MDNLREKIKLFNTLLRKNLDFCNKITIFVGSNGYSLFLHGINS